jgi:hypothetical protein
MFRTPALALITGSGLAYGAQLRATKEPVEVTGLEEYEPKDLHKDGLRNAVKPCDADTGPGPAKHSADWYTTRCNEINAHCKFLSDHRLNAARADRQFMKDECDKQKRILAENKDKHASEKADIVTQKAEVKEAKVDVQSATKEVKEYAHCPPELESAKAELARLQAIKNKVPADIDAECKAQQRVLDAQQCVDKLRAAEAVLSHKEGEHSEEKAELSNEKTHPAPAAAKIPPQEDKVIEACANYDRLMARPLPASVAGILSTCNAEKDDLLSGLEADLAALNDQCAREKAELSTKKDAHAEEKAEHKAQKIDAAATKVQVGKAEAVVKDYAHCPPELSEAKADLARLEAIPNKVQQDIDDECAAHQRILKAEKCVDKLRGAEAVLANRDAAHDTEKAQLSDESAERSVARAAVPPQKAVVAEVCADFEAAKAKWEAAHAACKA